MVSIYGVDDWARSTAEISERQVRRGQDGGGNERI
jgi:hypothetical protein